MKTRTYASWGLRLLAALIMVQSLFFKFSGAEESVYIFSKLGIEPWGRIGTGVAELIASILILVPSTISLGSLLTIGIMAGALTAHITRLGIEVKGDGGYLFILGVTAFACGIVLLFMYRSQIFSFARKLAGNNT